MLHDRLNPPDYTIDAHYMHGQSNLRDVAPNVASQIITSCDAHGFAIVRNTFSADAFAELRQDCLDEFAIHEEDKRVQHFDSSRAMAMAKTQERYTALSNASMTALGDLTLALCKAAETSPRMKTPDSDIDTAFVTRYEHRGKVMRHRDHNTGVICDTGLDGRALMGFWRGWRKIAEVIIEPNDTVVMPAFTQGNTKKHALTPHDVINITKQTDNNAGARRFSVVYNYGRTRPS